MRNITYKEAKRIINRGIELFMKRIHYMCSIQSHMFISEDASFPIFRPFSSDHNKYIQYTSRMECDIRECFIDYIIFNLLKKSGVPIKRWNKSRATLPVPELGFFCERNPIAFALEEEGEYVGYAYSFPGIGKSELKRLCKKYEINRINVIDWSDTDSMISDYGEILHPYDIRIDDVTLKAFFYKYFSDEIFDYYIKSTRDATKKANNEIGLRIVHQVLEKHISDIKHSLFDELIRDIKNTKYCLFNSDGMVSGKYILINGKAAIQDLEYIDRRFNGLKLYQSLFGGSDYARCFLTSEYLFESLNRVDGYSVDYTSVTAGYFKSIELILLKLMQATFYHKNHEELYIDISDTRKTKNIDQEDIIRKNGKKKIKFKKEFEQFFNTEMGALISFLIDNKDGWYVSGQTRNTIKEILQNYKNYCRNEHFHKDIISSVEDVEGIRHNTMLCIYYLLGSYKITGNDEEDRRLLECVDDTYDRLYREITRLPVGHNYYYMQFENEDIKKAYRLFNQERVEYDKEGNIISKIWFADIDEFNFENVKKIEENLSESSLFSISRDYYPQRVWDYIKMKDEAREIVW